MTKDSCLLSMASRGFFFLFFCLGEVVPLFSIYCILGFKKASCGVFNRVEIWECYEFWGDYSSSASSSSGTLSAYTFPVSMLNRP